MAKGTTDLSIVPVSAVHVDAYCDVWLIDHKANLFLHGNKWDWKPFDWHVIVLSQFETVAATDPQGALEGLIAIDPTSSGLLVVEYLQSAPKNHGKNGARRGVGTMLLRWAVSRSQKLGLNGALTLASTKEAELFYDGLKFAPAGKTSSGRKIYELRASEVARFLAATTIRSAGKP